LTEALLLHGEAGPMTDAFQPEQPARYLHETLRRMGREKTVRWKGVSLQSLARLKYIQSFPEVPYAYAYFNAITVCPLHAIELLFDQDEPAISVFWPGIVV
jgi:hypothetical protein